MKKTYLYLILIILIITAIISLGFYYFKKNSNKMSITAGQEKIEVTNILKNPIETFSNSDVEFKVTADYYFNYYANDQLFNITLINKDVNTARNVAEQDFLDTLQITKEQACKLNVQLGVPFSVNEKAAGVNYGLSFCPGSLAFPK